MFFQLKSSYGIIGKQRTQNHLIGNLDVKLIPTKLPEKGIYGKARVNSLTPFLPSLVICIVLVKILDFIDWLA